MTAVVERVPTYTSTTQAAWREYLNEIRDCDEQRYPEVEPWAWTRLQQRINGKDDS